MASKKKAPPPKRKAASKSKAKRGSNNFRAPKPKLPTLGAGLTGMGGTGASGMMP
jgi:hypothetical protein